MRLAEPLDELLRTRSHVRVLRAMSAAPAGIELSTREIARRAGVTHPTASTVLEALRKQGLVRVRRTPSSDQYRSNASHVLWAPVDALFRSERKVRDELVVFLGVEIRRRADWVTAAFLFGSAVGQDMRADSDIDLALICPRSRIRHARQLIEDLASLADERFGNRIHAVIGTRQLAELTKQGRAASRLWRRVAEDGIALLPPGKG